MPSFGRSYSICSIYAPVRCIIRCTLPRRGSCFCLFYYLFFSYVCAFFAASSTRDFLFVPLVAYACIETRDEQKTLDSEMTEKRTTCDIFLLLCCKRQKRFSQNRAHRHHPGGPVCALRVRVCVPGAILAPGARVGSLNAHHTGTHNPCHGCISCSCFRCEVGLHY